MHPDRARAHEIGSAFRLLLRHLPERERDGCAARAVDLIRQGQLDPAGVFVLRGPDALQGAIVCAPVPGSGAIVWPPAVAFPLGAAAEDLLVRAACAWLQQQGARLAQALLADDERALARPLLRHGFAHVTSLSYLHRPPALPGDEGPPTGASGLCTEQAGAGRLHFEPYDPVRPQLFHDTLVRTYEDTLDCPEVNGVRTVEEVIQGHKAQGCFDPRRWWLARGREPDAPVGVLIVSPAPEAGEWEVGYMGIVPEARRRGFGREMLRMALRQSHAAGVRRVSLCVDDRNLPAWGLYRSMGFELYDRRAVFLAVWRGRS
jgi:ribosomal protein S18 acetylase RimI-like enzyme